MELCRKCNDDKNIKCNCYQDCSNCNVEFNVRINGRACDKCWTGLCNECYDMNKLCNECKLENNNEKEDDNFNEKN